MRTHCLRRALPLLGLLISSAVWGAENPAWNELKQLSPGQRVRVVLSSKKSITGQFQSITDEAILLRADGTDQTLSRSRVQQVSSRRSGHRRRHALIGAAIGAVLASELARQLITDFSPTIVFEMVRELMGPQPCYNRP